MRSPQVSHLKDLVLSREDVWVRSQMPLTRDQHREAQDYAYHYGAHEVSILPTLEGYTLNLVQPAPSLWARLRKKLYDYFHS